MKFSKFFDDFLIYTRTIIGRSLSVFFFVTQLTEHVLEGPSISLMTPFSSRHKRKVQNFLPCKTSPQNNCDGPNTAGVIYEDLHEVMPRPAPAHHHAPGGHIVAPSIEVRNQQQNIRFPKQFCFNFARIIQNRPEMFVLFIFFICIIICLEFGTNPIDEHWALKEDLRVNNVILFYFYFVWCSCPAPPYLLPPVWLFRFSSSAFLVAILSFLVILTSKTQK